jgi:hypothetical protein
MTTRAAAEAFFIAGTNRAMFRFTLMNHMCMDMEQVLDTTIAPDRIRQDVSRGPGGDSRVFMNNCIGCHAGMDPLAQAFAYYTFDETAQRMVYTPGAVQPKYFNKTRSARAFPRTMPGTTTGARAAIRCLAGMVRCPARARVRSRSVASSRTATRSRRARCRRCSRTSVSACRATRRTAREEAMTASFVERVPAEAGFAEAATYCVGD